MNLKKETPLMIIVWIPCIYLVTIWNSFPEKVPMHWNMNGEVDRFGNKTELLALTILLPLVTYILFLIIPKIDPKKKIAKMGNKYQHIKFLITLFMSALALLIVLSAKKQSLETDYIILLMGVLYIVLGNYFKTIKPNFFIGIRTPWTLENEIVWKETHKLAGIMWFIGGIIIVLSSLITKKQISLNIFISITLIITLIPVIFSYVKFQKLSKT